MGEICRKEDIYFTVDAAYKGTGWVCPELRESGLEKVDCLLINFAKNGMMGM